MEKAPLFSVLIANYNDGGYIDNAIDSIKKQTYTNWEIIIVDDCSTDNSKTILEKYKKEKKINLFFNDRNYGCGYTKRKCVELANGEICAFVDADDAITPDAIEIMVNEHINYPNASLIYSYYFFCNKKLTVEYVSNHQCQIPDGTTFLEYKPGCVSHFATFKKAFYNLTTGINKTLLIAEDMDLYYKLEEVGRLIHIPKPLYYYRSGNTTHKYLGDSIQYANLWHFIAMTDACRRRDISIEKNAFPFLDNIIRQNIDIEIQKSKKTLEYQLCKIIIWPIKKIKLLLDLFNNSSEIKN